jgi:hypothetical protein
MPEEVFQVGERVFHGLSGVVAVDEGAKGVRDLQDRAGTVAKGPERRKHQA